MRNRGSGTASCDRTPAREERSLTQVEFVGSYPHADFELSPVLPEVAVFGRSNVGKSSLINATLRRKSIARTSRHPGKTQTCNAFRVDERYYLVDFPGYGFARVSKTQRSGFKSLYRRYIQQRTALRGVLWLLDIRRDPSNDDMELAGLLADSARPTIVVLTKADKLPQARRADRERDLQGLLGLDEEQCLVTSAKKKIGIEDLRQSIEHLIEYEG